MTVVIFSAISGNTGIPFTDFMFGITVSVLFAFNWVTVVRKADFQGLAFSIDSTISREAGIEETDFTFWAFFVENTFSLRA